MKGHRVWSERLTNRLLIGFTLVVSTAFSTAKAGFRYTPIEIPLTCGRAINNNLQIAGYRTIVPWVDDRAYLYDHRDGSLTELSQEPSGDGRAINDSGEVAGNIGGVGGFVYSGGTIIQLGSGHAWGINDLGHVVGETTVASGASRGFLWTPEDGITDLGSLYTPPSAPDIGYSCALAINDQGHIVGWTWAVTPSDPNPTHHACFWDEHGIITDLGTFGASNAEARDINGHNQIVVGTKPSVGPEQGFLWDGGSIAPLDTLGGPWTEPRAINEFGQIVGDSALPGGGWHGFLYENGSMIDLNTLIDPTFGVEVLRAYDIEDHGHIVCGGLYRDGTPCSGAFLLLNQGQVIPAPGAFLLASIGVGLVGWLRRCRTL